MPDSRTKLLLIGMADSVHLGRWILQFKDTPLDVTLFPSSPHRRIHPIIKGLIRAKGNNLTVTVAPSSMRWLALPLSVVVLILNNRSRAMLLRRVIASRPFDLIHVQEIQHAGYLLLGAGLGSHRSNVVVTNWGSDIFWFERFPRHKSRISELLKIATHYSAECHRDIAIVKKMGFSKAIMPVIPNGGGVDLTQIPAELTPTSHRRKIIIKGYTGFVGRATDSIRACEAAADCLDSYEVMVYSASLLSRLLLLRLRFRRGIRVRVIKKRTPQSVMLQHFAESRIYIGASLSDGISTSLLEAMATGCYPIQTGTSCANEWLTTTSGSIVTPRNISEICNAIRLAVQDDTYVDSAAAVNRSTIAERGSSAAVSASAINFYSMIARRSF